MDHDYFTAYTLYTSDNYAPDVYHTWCSYASLACCASRKVWLDIGPFRFYPNLFVVLDGEPGWGKDTAIDKALDVVRPVGNCTISATRSSKEDWVCDMAKSKIEYSDHYGKSTVQTPYLIQAAELAQWLSIDAIGTADLWTAMFNVREDFTVGTIKHGRQVIRRPYLNILAGVQPDKLAKYMSLEALSTGFLRRCNFIWPTTFRPKQLHFDVTPAMRSAFETCVQICRTVAGLSGSFTFTPEALDWYRDWFETRRPTANPLIRQYDENLHVQLLKLAMLTSLGYSRSLVIQRPYLLNALAHLEQVKLNLPNVLAGIGRNDLAKVSELLVNLLRDTKDQCLAEKDARIALWHHANAEEFLAVVAHLQHAGIIKIETGITQRGIPRQVLRLIT